MSTPSKCIECERPAFYWCATCKARICDGACINQCQQFGHTWYEIGEKIEEAKP